MRYAIPTVFLASPAFAYPVDLPHSDAADWAEPIAMALIIAPAFVARRQAVWTKR